MIVEIAYPLTLFIIFEIIVLCIPEKLGIENIDMYFMLNVVVALAGVFVGIIIAGINNLSEVKITYWHCIGVTVMIGLVALLKIGLYNIFIKKKVEE